MRKGQIAIETLLVYGLVILVVLLAIGALVRFGVLDLGKYLPDKCKIGSSALSCEEWRVEKANSKIFLGFKNTFGKNLDVKSIKLTGIEGSISGACNWVAGAVPVSIPINQKQSFELTGCSILLPKGEKVEGNMEVVFMQTGGLLDQTASGSISIAIQ